MGDLDRRVLGVALLLGACAPKVTPTPKPNIDPGRVPTPPVAVPAPPPTPKTPVLPPSEAYRRGLMPLASTNVWAYRQAHPTYDGRGVLVGIMDSGIDAGIAGLGTTPTGDPKILDLRDFSAEGRVPLAPIAVDGDSATIAGRRLGGLKRVRALGTGPVFGGALAELPLGRLPASDVNGDGTNTDRLPVLVVKASDGWVLFADANGNGTVEDDSPVHDYLTARETFGWSSGGRPSPLTVAVNFSGGGTPPVLDLFFDTSGHGTHVAGIAAGHDLYGVAGFDGSAPGAQLLGLKIANDALGGISMTGSMVRAMDYAIRFARARSLPLVLNMSFGVGNETEGTARIDAIIDSVLAANPEVVFVTSAGNDGPGLSTMGFPASAARVVTVGATFPPAFLDKPVPNGVIAYFSSRGAEVSKPDILAPGVAYSSVPRWDTGSEDMNGTSMASPHVAGAVAALVSAMKQEKRTVTAAQIKQSIVATARPLPGGIASDEGAGLLDLVAADRVLRKLPRAAVMQAHAGTAAAGAIYRLEVKPDTPDTTVTVIVEGTLGGPVQLVTDVPWLSAPPTVQLTPPATRIPVTIRSGAITRPGAAGGVVSGWASDTTIGPLFRVAATVIRPQAVPDSGLVLAAPLQAGELVRVFFAADSGRPFRVRVGSGGQHEQLLAFLHEPGGQPYRVENGQAGGFGEAAASYEVDGRDVVGGVYEAVAVAPPTTAVTAHVRIDRAPVSMSAVRGPKDTVTATLVGAIGGTASGTAMFGLIGAERTVRFSQSGGAVRKIPFQVAPWARRLVVEVRLDKKTWPLFTDFGLAVFDQDGQMLSADPLNYALGRASIDLPAATANRELSITLVPALADSSAAPLWDADVSIRLYAESPVLVDPSGKADFAVAAGQRSQVKFPLGKPPWPMPDGFFPLGNLVVDSHGILWGTEVRLPEAKPPLMR